MKNIFAFLTIVLALPVAFAQHGHTIASSSYSSSSSGDNAITADLGFAASAVHLGAAYEKQMSPMDLGGYLFIQTNKDKGGVPLVNQVISLGAYGKVHLTDRSHIDAYVAPGFGVHMIKDVVDGGTKSDKTTLGPILKVGAQYKLNSTTGLGLERTDLVNWFDDTAPSSFAYYSAVMTFEF